MDVLTGVLMSDGWLSHKSKNCSIEIEVIKEDYLNYLNEQIFPLLGTQVSLIKTPEEAVNNSGKIEGSNNPEDYNPMYGWRTVKHPSINIFREWREDGDKVWQKNTNITPTVLKHLYVGDGCFHQEDEYMKITTSNEMDNEKKVRRIFEDSGISIGNFRLDEYSDKVDIFFTKAESKRLFGLMGSPLPGFEYKWPKEYR